MMVGVCCSKFPIGNKISYTNILVHTAFWKMKGWLFHRQKLQISS